MEENQPSNYISKSFSIPLCVNIQLEAGLLHIITAQAKLDQSGCEYSPDINSPEARPGVQPKLHLCSRQLI